MNSKITAQTRTAMKAELDRLEREAKDAQVRADMAAEHARRMREAYEMQGSEESPVHFWTLSTEDSKRYDTAHLATRAWIDAGSPVPRGSSVWITEHLLVGGIAETQRTVTLHP